MSRRDELMALADRAEAATGADRALDALVALAAGYTTLPDAYGEGNDWWDAAGKALPRVRGFGAQPPKFTESVDVALSLIDMTEGIGNAGHAYFPNICRATRDLGGSAYWWVTIARCFERYRGEAATLPLTLTAAALRALAQETPE